MKVLRTKPVSRTDREGANLPMFDRIVDGESAAVTVCPPHGLSEAELRLGLKMRKSLDDTHARSKEPELSCTHDALIGRNSTAIEHARSYT